MESFAEVLESLVSRGPERIERFGASLRQAWIEEAPTATGTASIRRRKLPAEQVPWLVLGMALFQDRSIRDVVDHLGLVMPGDGEDSLAPSAVSNARGRLGPEPVKWPFNRVASQCSNQGGERGDAGLSLQAQSPLLAQATERAQVAATRKDQDEQLSAQLREAHDAQAGCPRGP